MFSTLVATSKPVRLPRPHPGSTNTHNGHAMAQAVSHRPLAKEAWVRARVNPCGICGEQSGTGTGFSPSSSAFPCQYHSTIALQLVSSGG
jgi:hypothetical protein